MKTMNRREMLKMSLAGASIIALNALPKKSFAAPKKAISLEECVNMSIEDIANSSDYVVNSMKSLKKASNKIKDKSLKTNVLAMLNNPSPSVLTNCDKQEVYKELKAKGFTKQSFENFLPPATSNSQAVQPFYTATGGGWTSHHSYPGGLATHTAFNVEMAMSMVENYKEIYDFEPSMDIAIAAQALHDIHKPWVFQWQENNTCRQEQSLAGTGEHHILSLAESIYRGLDSQVIIAQAGAHSPPFSPQDEANIINWLTAAAIINGKDPISLGLIAKDGKTLPLPRQTEAFITHIADHDYVLSVPSVQWVLPVMRLIAERKYNIKGQDLDNKAFNNLRNYVFAQVTAMTLYHEYAKNGEQAVENIMLSLVSPA